MILLLGYNMKIYEDSTLTNIECLHTCICLDVLQYSLHIQLFLPISVAIFCCRALDTLDLFFNYIFNLRMEVSFFFLFYQKSWNFIIKYQSRICGLTPLLNKIISYYFRNLWACLRWHTHRLTTPTARRQSWVPFCQKILTCTRSKGWFFLLTLM